MALIDEIARLRLATLGSHPEYLVGTEAAREAARQGVEGDLESAREVQRWGEDAVRAVVVVGRRQSRFGHNATHGRFELRLDVAHRSLLPPLGARAGPRGRHRPLETPMSW